MVVETGCQRLVGGKGFLDRHEATLEQEHSLRHVRVPERQFYRFGKGDPLCSTESRWLPAGIGGVPLLLRSSTVDAVVPLLGSRLFMAQSGAIIDNINCLIYIQDASHSPPALVFSQ